MVLCCAVLCCGAQDRAEVIQRAKSAGVAAIIVTGCTVPSAKAARDLCDSVQVRRFACSSHPHVKVPHSALVILCICRAACWPIHTRTDSMCMTLTAQAAGIATPLLCTSEWLALLVFGRTCALHQWCCSLLSGMPGTLPPHCRPPGPLTCS